MSVTTLRNLKSIISGDGGLEKIDPDYCDYEIIKEVLNIDRVLADKLETHFYYDESKKLVDIEGITPEIIDKIKEHFRVEE